MDGMQLLRFTAEALTVVAAILLAANWSPRAMLVGFSIFMAASIAWMIEGWIDNKLSLFIQISVLFVVNCFGVWRWMPRAQTASE